MRLKFKSKPKKPHGEVTVRTVTTTKPVFLKKSSGWVQWKLIGCALHEERDPGGSEPNMTKAKEAARKRQLEIAEEDKVKIKEGATRHLAKRSEIHPQCDASETSPDWRERA